MRIITLTAENVKRLKAVQITPDGNIVVISGRNAQGVERVDETGTVGITIEDGSVVAKDVAA